MAGWRILQTYRGLRHETSPAVGLLQVPSAASASRRGVARFCPAPCRPPPRTPRRPPRPRNAARVGRQHVAAGSRRSTMVSPPTQPISAAPSMTMIGKRSISLIISVLPKITSGMLIGQAEDQQHHAALRRGGHGDHVVQAHHQVGNQDGAHRGHQAAVGLALAVALFLVAQQLHADPQQQQAADDLQVRQREQLGRDHGQHDPQHHGGARAEQDGLASAAAAAASAPPAR